MKRRCPALLALLLVSFALAFPGDCTRGRTVSSRVFPGARVVLISIETLLSDHLSLYGYANAAQPLRAEDAFREEIRTAGAGRGQPGGLMRTPEETRLRRLPRPA